MLESVDVGKRSVADYEATAGREAEILRSEVPLLRDLGLAADWKIITDDTGFFAVTKTMHNALQGARRSLTDHEKEIYLTYSTRNAHLLDEEYDLIVAHDPQPPAVPHFHGRGGTRWVWRCHIDTSEPNENLWGFLRPYLDDYDAAVFTEKSFVPPVFPVPRVEIYRQIRDAASRDPDVDTFTNLTGVGNVEVNAFQRFSDVCVQKSIREGFGLVVSETLWKGTPMVAGEAGGIPMQMPGGTGGFLVGSVEECAEKLLFLLRNPEEGKELARSGKETIRKRFLLTRLTSALRRPDRRHGRSRRALARGRPVNTRRPYNPLVVWLLRSPLHAVMSRAVLLLTYRGRRSGRTRTTPVSYVWEGEDVLLVSSREHSWWKNLRSGAPVTLRIRGRGFRGWSRCGRSARGAAGRAGLPAALEGRARPGRKPERPGGPRARSQGKHPGQGAESRGGERG